MKQRESVTQPLTCWKGFVKYNQKYYHALLLSYLCLENGQNRQVITCTSAHIFELEAL